MVTILPTNGREIYRCTGNELDTFVLDLLIVSAPFTYTFGPSLAPALLKSCAEQKGISARAWDISAEFNLNYTHRHYSSITAWMSNPALTLSQAEYDWYKDLVQSYAVKITNHHRPRILAISVLSINSQRFTEDLSYHVKQLNSNIEIFLGGSGLDIMQHQFQMPWHNLMLNSRLADTVILGEGEFSLAQAIHLGQRGLIRVPQLTNQELDLVPVPNYDDYDFDLYRTDHDSYWNQHSRADPLQDQGPIFLVTASKGCVKNCSFCDVAKTWSKFRVRSAEKVAQEIICLHRRYGATNFSFTDSLMNGALKTFFSLNQTLAKKLPRTIRYEGQIICRDRREMPEKYFKAMADAGCCRVSVGMESGSEKVRLHMGKGSSQAALHYTTEMLIKYNIQQQWNIIAGYPTETDQDWKDTMDVIRYWLPRSHKLLTISPISTFLLLEGTPMTDSDDFKDLGLETSIVQGYSGFAWTSRSNPDNTFKVRCERFAELCYYLMEYDLGAYASLDHKLKKMNKQLEWYTNNVRHLPKIYDISSSLATKNS